MDRVNREDVQRYLDANYLTLEDLSARAGALPERVLELVDALCVPPHSHEARGVAIFASTFGEYTASVPPVRYYHPSLVDWVRKASALARRHTLADVARRMRKDFEDAFEAALDGRPPPWPRGVSSSMSAASTRTGSRRRTSSWAMRWCRSASASAAPSPAPR